MEVRPGLDIVGLGAKSASGISDVVQFEGPVHTEQEVARALNNPCAHAWASMAEVDRTLPLLGLGE